MARTKTSRRSQSANKKLVTPAQKKRIDVQVHRAWVSASDIEPVDSDDAAVQAMSTPTVTLTDINLRKSTPKLSTPVMAAQSDSEESAIAATPTSSRKSLPPPPPPHLGISGSTSSKAEETMRELLVHGRPRGRFV